MIVLDSSFLIAYYNTRDIHHPAAARTMVQILGEKWGRGLLLEYVFLETVTVLRARRDAGVAASVGKTLLSAAELDFVPCSGVFNEAFEIFQRLRQHNLSFVDAAIVAVAMQNAPGFIATFDQDFSGIRGIKVVTA
jgi:predicted nucleic acid-binding protein